MRRAVFAIAALFLASPLAAQDGSETSAARTPENAQRFLSEIVSKSDVGAQNYGQMYAVLLYKVREFRNESQCVSVLEATPRGYVLREDSGRTISDLVGEQGRPDLFAPHQQLIASRGLVQAPYRIEWGKIGSIIQSPISVAEGKPLGDGTLSLQSNAWTINIRFTSGELASRAKFAMETLKKACDPVADTGF